MKKLFLIIGILFGMFCFGCFTLGIIDGITNTISDNQPSTNNKTQQTQDNKEEKNQIEEQQKEEAVKDFDIEISLKEMSEIYYNNKLNGNKLFFGKKVKTQAKFDETSSGIFSGLIAYFDGINSMYGIHCTSFDKETKQNLSTFNRGETLNIIGTVDELVSSSIKFKECKIFK